MYRTETDIERDALRQGDVITNVLLLCAINLRSVNFIVDAEQRRVAYNIAKPPDVGRVMILSNSCEIDVSNGAKVTTIVVAPLRDAATATSKERLNDLKISNFITEDTAQSYLKYFYLSPHRLLADLPEGAVVDFAKCFSLRKESYEELLHNKQLQLNDAAVDAMAFKLALYFCRNMSSAAGLPTIQS